MKPRVRGFTLIELLVVISIIALLIAILLPALGAARASAKQLQCLSNIKQINAATIAYTVDNDNYFPDSPGSIWNWVGKATPARPRVPSERAINEYLLGTSSIPDDVEILMAQCPEDGGSDAGAPRIDFWAPGNSVYESRGTSYAIPRSPNHNDTSAKGSATPRKIDTVIHTTELLISGETSGIRRPWGERAPTVDEWHTRLEFFNMNFADGHSEYIEIEFDVVWGEDYRADDDDKAIVSGPVR